MVIHLRTAANVGTATIFGTMSCCTTKNNSITKPKLDQGLQLNQWQNNRQNQGFAERVAYLIVGGGGGGMRAKKLCVPKMGLLFLAL